MKPIAKTPHFDHSQFAMVSMSFIELNDGQLPGLPKNPRGIKDHKYKQLKQNIESYPEMLIARSLLVYPLDETGERYIIIGGNMRYLAMSELGHTHAPVFVIPRETSIERLKAYTIIDNGDFGEWDFDALANEWDDLPLNDLGISIPSDWTLNPEDLDEEFSLPDADKGNVQHMGFVLSAEQSELIKSMIKTVQENYRDAIAEIDGNTNKNGNALYLIVSQWAEQRK